MRRVESQNQGRSARDGSSLFLLPGGDAHGNEGYWVIIKKFSFGIFSIIKTTKNREFFAAEKMNSVLSLSNF